MRTSAKITLTFTLLFVLVPTGLAQKNQRACPVPPPSPFKHQGRIVTSFDRSTGGMRTTLEHPRVLSNAGGELYLYASFTHQDPRRRSPLMVDIAFLSTSKQARYRDSHNLVFMTDGQMLNISARAPEYNSQRDERGLFVEMTKLTIPFDSLLNLTRARKVAARIGATEVELTNNHLEALRELASLMQPSQPQRTWATH